MWPGVQRGYGLVGNYVKTCEIAEVKREMGLTRGPAPNRLSSQPKVKARPEVKPLIREAITEAIRQRGRVPTYREVGEAVSRQLSRRSIVAETRGRLKLPPALLKTLVEDKSLLYED